MTKQGSGSVGWKTVGADIGAGLGLLSRLPVPVDGDRAMARGARAAWAWPVAGAVLGGIAALAGLLADALGLPAGIAAGLALAVQVAITGALHEDGLADSADGLWGGWDRTRRLAIMKDSRIGTYGVIALILSLMLRWVALTALIAAGAAGAALIAAAMISRAGMAVLMAWLPAAREGGLSDAVGRPGRATAGMACAVALGGATLAVGAVAAATATLVVAAVLVGWGLIARARIGGQTGDILGAGQQLAEVAVLLVLVAGR